MGMLDVVLCLKRMCYVYEKNIFDVYFVNVFLNCELFFEVVNYNLQCVVR